MDKSSTIVQPEAVVDAKCSGLTAIHTHKSTASSDIGSARRRAFILSHRKPGTALSSDSTPLASETVELTGQCMYKSKKPKVSSEMSSVNNMTESNSASKIAEKSSINLRTNSAVAGSLSGRNNEKSAGSTDKHSTDQKSLTENPNYAVNKSPFQRFSTSVDTPIAHDDFIGNGTNQDVMTAECRTKHQASNKYSKPALSRRHSVCTGHTFRAFLRGKNSRNSIGFLERSSSVGGYTPTEHGSTDSMRTGLNMIRTQNGHNHRGTLRNATTMSGAEVLKNSITPPGGMEIVVASVDDSLGFHASLLSLNTVNEDEEFDENQTEPNSTTDCSYPSETVSNSDCQTVSTYTSTYDFAKTTSKGSLYSHSKCSDLTCSLCRRSVSRPPLKPPADSMDMRLREELYEILKTVTFNFDDDPSAPFENYDCGLDSDSSLKNKTSSDSSFVAGRIRKYVYHNTPSVHTIYTFVAPRNLPSGYKPYTTRFHCELNDPYHICIEKNLQVFLEE
ncbi:hypothetical protein AB6A40_004778 [Gnathostoma spinigerum]|uniref:Uncharacterized protein n=1 Tax=Gnathostoma spinigerum TaxID=75299 RepID=A0ABD6EIV3_9BILA